MFKNTYTIVLLILSTIFALLLLKRYIDENSPSSKKKEGFIQEAPFIIKRNENAYDEFVAKIYDKIFHSNREPYYNEMQAFKTTQPDKDKSVILDLGCGTGDFMKDLMESGYKNVYGLDNSSFMADEAHLRGGDMKIKVGDASKQSMLYDKSVFTHVFCIGMTIYDIKDKIAFFRNCFLWLKPNGYLILHCVNRDRFQNIVPSAAPLLLDGESPGKYVQERITTSEVSFPDFKYKSEYDFTKTDVVVFKETFTDVASSKVRQNEKELFMPNNMENILFDAQYCGFLVVGQITMNIDENQFLFILERPH